MARVILFENIYPHVDLSLTITETGFKYDIIADDASYLEQVQLVYHLNNLNQYLRI